MRLFFYYLHRDHAHALKNGEHQDHQKADRRNIADDHREHPLQAESARKRDLVNDHGGL